jgi:hypothetical protein
MKKLWLLLILACLGSCARNSNVAELSDSEILEFTEFTSSLGETQNAIQRAHGVSPVNLTTFADAGILADKLKGKCLTKSEQTQILGSKDRKVEIVAEGSTCPVDSHVLVDIKHNVRPGVDLESVLKNTYAVTDNDYKALNDIQRFEIQGQFLVQTKNDLSTGTTTFGGGTIRGTIKSSKYAVDLSLKITLVVKGAFQGTEFVTRSTLRYLFTFPGRFQADLQKVVIQTGVNHVEEFYLNGKALSSMEYRQYINNLGPSFDLTQAID